MNEVQESKFDYKQLDDDTAEYLLELEKEGQKATNDFIFIWGKVLLKGQEKLKNGKYGCFMEWYNSLGFSKDTARNYMNVAENLNCENFAIKNIQKTILYKIAEPNVNEELKERVLNGEIKTHKEYKELEKKIKDAEAQLKETEKKYKEEEQSRIKTEKEKNDLARQYKELESKPPKVITEIKIKENRVEVLPKEKEQQLQQYEKDVTTYQSSLKELNEQKSELENKIKKWEECDQLDAEKRKLEIEKHISIFELQIKIKKFLEESTPSLFLQGAIASTDLLIKRELKQNVNALERFTKELKNIIASEIEFEDAEYREVN